jgi:hypothetical protein
MQSIIFYQTTSLGSFTSSSQASKTIEISSQKLEIPHWYTTGSLGEDPCQAADQVPHFVASRRTSGLSALSDWIWCVICPPMYRHNVRRYVWHLLQKNMAEPQLADFKVVMWLLMTFSWVQRGFKQNNPLKASTSWHRWSLNLTRDYGRLRRPAQFLVLANILQWLHGLHHIQLNVRNNRIGSIRLD